MKLVSFVMLITFLISTNVVTAQTTIREDAIVVNGKSIVAGMTPDSPLYFIDTALDQIRYILTFDNTAKARLGLEIARERLMEVREMALENKIEAMQRAQQEHKNYLDNVKSAVGGISRTNSTEELEEEIEIEKDIEEHETEIETVTGEIKIKIEIKGNITSEQQALIDSILGFMQNKTGEVKIKIDNRKGETKIKIKTETGKSEEEIDDDTKEIERKKGLTEMMEKKTEDMRTKANEHISALEKNVNCSLLPSSVDIPVDVSDYTNKTTLTPNETLKLAKEILTDSETKEDWEDAKDIAELAKDIADKVNQISGRGIGYWRTREECPKPEEVLPGVIEEPSLKIEAEIKGNQTKVEIEIEDAEWKFILNTTNRDKIISEIASKTGLTISEIEDEIKFEIEEKKEKLGCETDSDCVGKIVCPQVIGQDTPICKDGKCVCGSKVETKQSKQETTKSQIKEISEKSSKSKED